jgi:hypothetical protein
MSRFRWKENSELAAIRLAENELTTEEIAAEAKIPRSTLWNWRKHPEFAARVDAAREQIRDEVMAYGIADRIARVRELDRRWRKMRRVIEERAADPKMEGVPGAATGLIVHDVKGVGKGDDFQLIDMYQIDTGLLSELRNTEKQAAQELGQWEERSIVDDRRKAYDEINSPAKL